MDEAIEISESPCPEETSRQIIGCAAEARQRLGIQDSADSYDIIATLDSELRKLQNSNSEPPESPFDEDPLHFGSLWGEQIVKSLGWEWVKLTFHAHDDFMAYAVVSPDRSLMICPFHFAFGCLLNGAPVTIELSYNFLIQRDSPQVRSRTIGPAAAAGSYSNVMERVHHIIPPG